VRESAPAIQSVSTPFLPDGRYRNPIPFGSAPSPVRLWGKGLGDQDGWTVPIAVFGTIAIALLAFDRRRRRGPPPGAVAAAADGSSAAGPAAATDPHTDGASAGGPAAAASPRAEDEGRRDPRLATAIVLGGWFLVEGAVLSFSKGIVHPYYVSALAPATGAMAGGGIVAIAALRLGKRPRAGAILAALAVLGTVGAQVVLLHREQYLLWLIPVLIGGGALAVGVLLAVRSLTVPALAAAFCLLLIAPTAYSTTTWLAPVEGTFPAAGPKAATGAGGLGISGRSLRLTHALAAYIGAHRPGSRWSILTVASDASAPFILLGVDAGAVGGYSGTDPALDGRSLARLVSRGEARYVLLGGVYSSRGGNLATKAVLQACRQIAPHLWHDPFRYANGLGLFDCAGHERALAAAPSGGRT
jgi:hypothetical protein